MGETNPEPAMFFVNNYHSMVYVLAAVADTRSELDPVADVEAMITSIQCNAFRSD